MPNISEIFHGSIDALNQPERLAEHKHHIFDIMATMPEEIVAFHSDLYAHCNEFASTSEVQEAVKRKHRHTIEVVLASHEILERRAREHLDISNDIPLDVNQVQEIVNLMHSQGHITHTYEEATVTAVLHDLGRSVQALTGTFKDGIGEGKSGVDHAEVGANIYKNSGIYTNYKNIDPDKVFNAIKYHGVKEVPDENRTDLTDHIRDSDKIVIIRRFDEQIAYSQEQFKGENTSIVSEKIMQSFNLENGSIGCIDNRDLKTFADSIAKIVSWVCDFNSHHSVNILREENIIQRMLELVTQSSLFNESQAEYLLQTAQKFLDANYGSEMV